MRISRKIWAVIGLIGTLSLAGCNNSDTPTDSTLSESDYEQTTGTTISEDISETTAASSEYSMQETVESTAEITVEITTGVPTDMSFVVIEPAVKMYKPNADAYGEISIFEEPADISEDVLEKARKSFADSELYISSISSNTKAMEFAEQNPDAAKPEAAYSFVNEATGELEAKVKYTLTEDFSGDGNDETLIIFRAPSLIGGGDNDPSFVVYINDNGEAKFISEQTGYTEFGYLLDYGNNSVHLIIDSESASNSSQNHSIFSFDGESATELLSDSNELLPDAVNNRIFFRTWSPDYCEAASWNPDTQEYERYEVAYEEYTLSLDTNDISE